MIEEEQEESRKIPSIHLPDKLNKTAEENTNVRVNRSGDKQLSAIISKLNTEELFPEKSSRHEGNYPSNSSNRGKKKREEIRKNPFDFLFYFF